MQFTQHFTNPLEVKFPVIKISLLISHFVNKIGPRLQNYIDEAMIREAMSYLKKAYWSQLSFCLS